VAWRNGPAEFGLVSRILHWLMAAGVLLMLALGSTLVRMEPGLGNLWLYGLHKTIGICLLALVILRLIWHRISPPPRPIGPASAWATRLARLTHGALYALLVIIPLSGWSASSATGIDVMFLDRWILPPLAPVSAAWEDAGFAVHGLATKLLMVLLVLHVAGALWRAWDGDGTLRRMIRGRA
jgi:cytochrome b561